MEVGAVEIVAVSFGSGVRQVQSRQRQDAMHEELVRIGNLWHFDLPDITDHLPIRQSLGGIDAIMVHQFGILRAPLAEESRCIGDLMLKGGNGIVGP